MGLDLTYLKPLLPLFMKLDPSKSVGAIFIAPLVAGGGFVINYWHPSDGFIDTLSALAFITPIAYSFALVAIFVIGLPVYFLLRYLNVLNFFTLSFVGLPLGFLVSVVTGDLNDSAWIRTACISSVLVSTAASLIMLKRPNRSKVSGSLDADAD